MRERIIACILIEIMLFCSPAVAAPRIVEFKLLSPGHALTLNDGIKVRYYRLSEYLELNRFDQELVKLRADLQDFGDLNNKLKTQVDVLEHKLIPTLENDKEILRKRGLRLNEKWEKCEEARVDAEGGSILSYVVGAVGAALGIVGVTMWAVESAKSN